MAEQKNEVLKKARIEMNYLTGEDEVRRLAELEEKWEMDRVSEVNYAKSEGIKQGKKEGIEQGKKEGIEQGKKEGIEQGKKEGIKQGKKAGAKETKKETATKMLKEKMPLELIVKITGLTKEEINKIRHQ